MDAVKFWTHVEPELNTGCWLWSAAINDLGYGKLSFNGRTQKAHRVAWSLRHGSIADGLCVCHRCDTPACVNPGHLWLGSHRANAEDKVAKGRARNGTTCGEANVRATITADQAREIRRLSGTGWRGPRISASLGISINVVRQVARGYTWADV